jgi:transposase
VRLAALLPRFAGLRLLQVDTADDPLTLHVAPIRQGAPCPVCRRRSTRRHSWYVRTLADLPWGGRPVRIILRVRRFRCRNRACPRKVFAERFPKLAAGRARRTLAQMEALSDYGFVVGGAPGARLASGQGLHGSRRTILRAVRAMPLPAFPTPRVLGVDDWARRKGQTYGTILVDLERRQVVDLLEDRTAATLATWLREHEGVEVIARDRAGAYADGAREGAPDAIQVADRFHLLVNAGEALERVLARKHVRLREAARVVDQSRADESADEVQPVPEANGDETKAPSRKERERQARRDRRQARFDAVRELADQGWGIQTIARHLHMGRKAVRRMLRAGNLPEPAPPRRRPTILDSHLPYLQERWAAGCHNAHALWVELCGQGFTGSPAIVRRLVGAWRPGPGRSGRPAQGVTLAGQVSTPPRTPPTRALSPRQARWLLLRRPPDSEREMHAYREQLLRSDSDIRQAYDLTVDFEEMVRQRERDKLAPWLERASGSQLPELVEFAHGLERDRSAVEAALTHEWSSGQVEGQITKLKLRKRESFGRASFELLKRRVLRAA